MRRSLLLSGLLVLFASAAFAHWTDHPDQPDWARRGYVQWGHGANIDGRIQWNHGGFGLDVPNTKLLLSCGRNMEQTVSYTSPEAEKLGRDGGLRRQPYICSETVWWRSEFKDAPELAGAVRLQPDGSHTIMYKNAERYPGCYNQPFYLQYMKRRVDATMKGQGGRVDSIFFDNPVPYDCYCKICQDKFRTYTREKSAPRWTC